MASLFADLRSGFRMPDVQMNKGPLPNTAGGPAGSDGTADGRYNFNTELLSGITPYAYGEAARMGSDRNYQQIPHRIQKIIPPLYLPQRDGKAGQPKLAMTHAVDQGDVAFAVNLGADNQHLLLSPEDTFITKNDNVLASFTPFCNLATVNYLLAGLWRYGDCPGTRWMELSKAFNCGSLCGYEWNHDKITKKNTAKPVDLDKKVKHVENIHCLLRTCIMPFGICAGSEHQGGMHELSLAPVTAAVNYVTVMTIDGQNRDLVNFWRANTLSAGDELIYRLDYRRTKQYTLNHFYKNVTHASFDDEEHFAVGGITEKMICPQLVPDVRTPFMTIPPDAATQKEASHHKYSELANMQSFFGGSGRHTGSSGSRYYGVMGGPMDMTLGVPAPSTITTTTTTVHASTSDHKMLEIQSKLNYRWAGYWRVGQLMHHRGAHVKNGMEYNCDTDFLTGGLLQVTFAPVWRECKPKHVLTRPVTPHAGRKPSSALTAVMKGKPTNPSLDTLYVTLDAGDAKYTYNYKIESSQLQFTTTRGGKFEQKFIAEEGDQTKEINMLIEDAAKILSMQEDNNILTENLHDCGLTLDIGHHNTRCTGFHPSGGGASFTFQYGNNYQYTMTLQLYESFFTAVKKHQAAYDAEIAMKKTSSSASIMPMSSSINKSGFLGKSAGSTQPTQPTQSNAHRGTSVSAQLSGLFGGEASAQDASNDDDDAARASKVPKKTSTETATLAEPSPAAKKTQAAQSIGQSMKSMLTGARGKAAPKGKTVAAPSAPKDVATTDKTDIVPDDPMDDA